MARYNDLETSPEPTVDDRGPLAIDLTAGQAMIARRRRSETEGPAVDAGAAVHARLPAARNAYLANSRAAFTSAFTPSRGVTATVYA